MSEQYWPFSCHDFTEMSGTCCSSCHEDVEYGYELCEREFRGKQMWCCCKSNPNDLDPEEQESVFKQLTETEK